MAPRSPGILFDHLVGAREQRWWDFEAECLGGVEIEHKLEFRGRLNGKVARRCTAQYSINVRCRFPKHLIDVPRENCGATLNVCSQKKSSSGSCVWCLPVRNCST